MKLHHLAISLVLCAACSRNAARDPEATDNAAPAEAPEAPAHEPEPVATSPGVATNTPVPAFRPGAPNTAQTVVEGCLADGPQAERGADRGATADTSRGGGFDAGNYGVTVTTTGTGAIVTHHFNHLCCLEAEVSTSVEGGQVTIAEALSGDPCKCMCDSTVKTAVGLEPGSYTLVYTQRRDHEEPRTVAEQPIEIRRLSDM